MSWSERLNFLKIALVILHADPARGGAERYTIDLAAELIERGHEVWLLASSFGQVLPEGVHRELLRATGLTRWGQYGRFLDSLDAHLNEVRYDIVHAMLPVRRADLYHPHAGIAAEAVDEPSLMGKSRNQLNRRRSRMAAVERQMLESNPKLKVLCLSKYVKKIARQYYPQLDEGRLITLFNGIDTDRFDPAARPTAGTELRQRLGIATETVVGLMLAQDFERKGLRQAIQALGQLNDPRLLLLVAGKDGPGPYQDLADSLCIQKRVRFTGPTDDPYAFYRAADFFVLPTRHDPCSLVVLEALAMGVPVISTVFNGACEIMSGTKQGFVLGNPKNIPDLASAISQMADAKQRQIMHHDCLKLRPRLSQKAHVNELERVYRDFAIQSEGPYNAM